MTGIFIAVAFSLGLALGFVAGVAAYGSIYALFLRWHEERTRQRIVRAEQHAAKRAQELAAVRQKMRSIYGDRLDGADGVDEEIEKILSSGPVK